MSEQAEVMEPEVADKELPPPEIQNMIQHAMDQEYSQANNIFGELMTVKLNDILDQEKVRLADQIYNGVEDAEEDPDEDQLELDLEGESESESEEEDDEEEHESDDDEEDLDDENSSE